MTGCNVAGCERKHEAKGYCCAHYHSFMKYGDPLRARHGMNGKGWTDKKGYLHIPDGNGRSIKESRSVAEKAIGRKLPKHSIVHHVDEDPTNNRNDNLVICPSPGYHRQVHMRLDALKATGHADWRKCPYCHKYDSPENLVKEKVRSVHRVCRNLLQKRIREAKNGVRLQASC